MNRSLVFLLSTLLLSALSGTLQAQEQSTETPPPEQQVQVKMDGDSAEVCSEHGEAGMHGKHGMHGHARAPIGIMGSHVHGKGEFMLSYRYARMEMDGMQSGTDSVSTEQVLQDYMAAMTSMTTQMHMFGAMYGLTDGVTLAAMIPWIEKQMEMENRMGNRFTTNSSGFGDLKAVALFPLLRTPEHRIIGKAGLSFPTGSINATDTGMNGNEVQMAYPMQLGSGTYDVLAAATYVAQADDLNWGLQLAGIVRMGRNSRDYRLGDRLRATTWIGHEFGRFNPTLRLDYQIWSPITGADAELNPMMMPGTDAVNSGGQRLNGVIGIDFKIPELASGGRLAIEVGLPIYQDLNGIQGTLDWVFVGGLQFRF